MVEKAEEQTTTGVSTLGILILLLGIVAIGLGATLIPGVRDALGNWFGVAIGVEENEKINENFDKIIENIQTCDEIDDKECVCEVWPDFPVVFPAKAELIMDLFIGEISMDYGQKQIEKSELSSDLEITNVYFVKEKGIRFFSQEEAIVESNNRAPLDANSNDVEKINFDFSEQNPKAKIIGDRGGKIGDTANIFSKYFFKSRSGFLQIPVSGWMASRLQDSAQLKVEFEKIPVCIGERKTAISKLIEMRNRLTSASLNEVIEVVLPPGFYFSIDGNFISLYYDKQKVKELKENPQQSGHYLVSDVSREITIPLCSNSNKNNELDNSDKILIKEENGAGCLLIN